MHQHLSILLCTLVAALTILKVVQACKRKPLPPGPRGRYPLLGMTFDEPKYKPWEEFTRWAKMYGPLVYYRTGLQHVVIINDASVYRELITQRSDIYSSRPPSEVGSLVSGGLRVVQMEYGHRWRIDTPQSVRRVFTKVLNAKKCDSYLGYQEREALATLYTLLHNKPEDFSHEIHRYSLSVARTVAFSKRVTSSNSPFGAELREVMANFSSAMQPGKYIVETMPFLGRLPHALQPWRKELAKYHEIEADFSLRCYREALAHAEKYPDQPSVARDIAKEMTDEALAATTCMEIIGAGAETTASTLGFIILALITHPEVVKKAHEELDRVIGRDRFPTWTDEPNLPYIRAIIKEAHRWRVISPLSFQHYTMKEDVFRGYRIPKGSVVRVNHWGMHLDESRYPDPYEFNPERFVNYKLSAAAACNLPNPAERDHFAYGAGKRICPGLHLAERSLYNITSRLLQTFAFEQPRDPKTGELLEIVTVDNVGTRSGLVMAPGRQFDVDFKLRDERIGTLLESEWRAKVSGQGEIWQD
ncbi:cytochrome P450 [Fusarium acutatum]|uniref:Cytochrome P450 n=1 Tax=Fusarium acutatum TaxID=78861 RepID=A0A8H4JX43_9HYPO|nr:cytochrome P450 [Fusarium acutatum]